MRLAGSKTVPRPQVASVEDRSNWPGATPLGDVISVLNPLAPALVTVPRLRGPAVAPSLGHRIVTVLAPLAHR
jgi:hypothetical protein